MPPSATRRSSGAATAAAASGRSMTAFTAHPTPHATSGWETRSTRSLTTERRSSRSSSAASASAARRRIRSSKRSPSSPPTKLTHQRSSLTQTQTWSARASFAERRWSSTTPTELFARRRRFNCPRETSRSWATSLRRRRSTSLRSSTPLSPPRRIPTRRRRSCGSRTLVLVGLPTRTRSPSRAPTLRCSKPAAAARRTCRSSSAATLASFTPTNASSTRRRWRLGSASGRAGAARAR